jgi:hypothetical protein
MRMMLARWPVPHAQAAEDGAHQSTRGAGREKVIAELRKTDLADMPTLYAVIIAAVVIGLAGIAWGIRMRVLKVHGEAGAAAHRAELDRRNLLRDERRRAALTPAQRAADDAMFAAIDLSPKDES